MDMRTAIDLVTEEQIAEAPMLYTTDPRIDLYVIRSRSDFYWLLRQCEHEELRGFILRDGTVVAWDGYYDVHHDMIKRMKEYFNASGQMMPEIVVHLVLRRNAVEARQGENIAASNPILRSIYGEMNFFDGVAHKDDEAA